MPRANDKPFPCKDCRFRVGGRCRRNPPTGAEIVQYLEAEVGNAKTCDPVMVAIGVFPAAGEGCFAGEPIKRQRSCMNCGKEDCLIPAKLDLKDIEGRFYEPNMTWHCSDWELKE
jgi:hypothetical protein